MKTIFVLTVIISLFAFIPGNKLNGRWVTQPSPTGRVTGVIFTSDTSFDAYVNNKPFVSGYYTFKDNIFSFTDNGCNGMPGIYEIKFSNNDDTLRFIPIMDSCADRKRGMSALVLGKVK